MGVHYVPEGFHSVTPYLAVKDATVLIDFLSRAFAAEEVECMKGPDGRVMHAEMRLGDTIVEMADAREEWPAMPTALHYYVPDADAVYAAAIEAGAESLHEPMDMFYGERAAAVRDPVGNHWYIATHVEDVPSEEIERRAREQHG